MQYTNFGDYIGGVIAHINAEYENNGLLGKLTDIQKDEIRYRLLKHYNTDNSTSNAAGDIIEYVRVSSKI